MRTRFSALLSLLVLVMLVVGPTALAASPVQQGTPPGLYLKAGVVPPGQRPTVPPGLSTAAPGVGGGDYYIVQFYGPIEQAWKDEIKAEGAEILDYIPDFAFKVRMTPGAAKKVAELASVSWLGPFRPVYKLSPDLAKSGTRLYTLRVERGADYGLTRAAIATSGARIESQEGGILVVAADEAQVAALAEVSDVAWIENYALREKLSTKANEFGGGVIMGAAAANNSGYDGSTQTVAVADTGLGGGTAATAHRDIASTRVTAIYNWPGATGGCFQSITDDGAIDVDSGHGTHVAVSVLGSGGPGGIAKGTAPVARLVFQSTENWVKVSNICKSLYGYVDGYYLTGIPTDLRTLFQQAYDAGARIHSNSWGSAVAGDYTVDSANADSFIWSHPDMLVSFSAGNEGIDANADGDIDNDSTGSPATAKNVLTVGASENDRPSWTCDTTLTYTSCAAQSGGNFVAAYGTSWPSDYPAAPIKSDPAAGNAQQMAAFSSRGPTDDGRIKPDVVAPGTWILSGYPDLYQQGYDSSPNPKNGAWQYDGWGFPFDRYYKYMGGTSMSNPLTAGGAAVVKDYYQKAKSVTASAALVKATLINTAVDLLDENNDGADDNDYRIPNNHEGWGRVDLAKATNGSVQFADASVGLNTNGTATYQVTTAGGAPLKVTLVWSDYPSTETVAKNLVNDLDLKVTAPGGAVYNGNVFSGGWSQTGGSADRANNVENVYISSAADGTWKIEIKGYNIPSGPQKYALAVSGGALSAPSQPSATGFKSPTVNAPVTTSSGDNNGYEVSPANAYASDNSFAVDNNSGTGTNATYSSPQKDRHVFQGFAFGVPAGATIKGIEVKLEAKVDNTNGAPKMYVELSADGGATWSAAKVTPTLSKTKTAYVLGSGSDLWSGAWSGTNIGALRLRITDVASNTSRDFSLDSVAVQVTYQ